jgi:hypothetical protein
MTPDSRLGTFHGRYSRCRTEAGYASSTLPDAEFLTVVELSLQASSRNGPERQHCSRGIAYIFSRRRLPYTVSDDGDISWNGEPEITRTAIEPALSALKDDRLTNARTEFADARSELRADRFDDAVNDAGKGGRDDDGLPAHCSRSGPAAQQSRRRDDPGRAPL